jgi:hypothetical protein
LYYVARLDDYFDRLPTPTWLFDTPWAVALMTWSVIVVELLGPILLWFKETRRVSLAAIVLFHLANEWTMHLFLFHWVMLCGWMAFLSPEDFAWIGRLASGGRASASGGPALASGGRKSPESPPAAPAPRTATKS